MKNFNTNRLFFLGFLFLISCNIQEPEKFFGLEASSDSAMIFAPGIISLEDRFEQAISISPNGKEIVFGISNENWDYFRIYGIRYENGEWTEAKKMPFMSQTDGLSPSFSPDGNKIYYVSSFPAYPDMNIWMAEKTVDGWTKTKRLGEPVNSDSIEFEVSVSKSNTLYFSSNREISLGMLDIFFCMMKDGKYGVVRNIGDPVSSVQHEDCPAIAPDESYLIFASHKESGYGQADLYISFQKYDGSWSIPRNLGSIINTNEWELYPSISPDGKYLFFTRREKRENSTPSNIYWISTDFLEKFK